MDRSAQSRILIVGAGLAGLSLALALAKNGIKTTVVEKQSEVTPSRWAILLYPFGMKIFDELGVLEDLSPLGIPLKPPEVVTEKGESLAVINTGLLSEARLNYSLLLGPSEIRKVLKEKALALGVELLEGHKFRDLVRDPASSRIVGATVEADGGAMELQSKVVVGADGYKSRVREQFGVKTRERTYPVVAAFFLEHEHGLDHMKMILGKGSQIVVLPCTRTLLNLGYTESGLTADRLERLGGSIHQGEDERVRSLPEASDSEGLRQDGEACHAPHRTRSNPRGPMGRRWWSPDRRRGTLFPSWHRIGRTGSVHGRRRSGSNSCGMREA